MSASSISRVRVKICGITNREDAEIAIACGADALGFNTWPETKRHIDLNGARVWIRTLPPFVSRVALCVNASLKEAVEIGRSGEVDMVQFHGDEDSEYCMEFSGATGIPFIKALRIRTEADLTGVEAYGTPHVLIDAHVQGQYGGTGAPVNLELARTARERLTGHHLILAGGLRPENVAEAVRAVRPYAVDVSSGVESRPGKKDPALVKAFVEAVRSCE